METNTVSRRYSLNRKDASSILRGTGYAAGGAALAYLLTILADIDFGQWGPILIPMASIMLNAAIKFLREQQRTNEVE